MSEISKHSDVPHGPDGPERLATARFRDARAQFLADRSLTGRGWAAAMSGLVDGWLGELFAHATKEQRQGSEALALLAVGGYGRGELCPGSDVDVLLVHRGRRDVAEVAERLWYPAWDGGLPLGHAVRSLDETLDLASRDLDTATGLLTPRLIAGDALLATETADAALARWRKRGRQRVAELAQRVEDRQARSGEVAYLLEPDLKDGRGGQRDVHSLVWAELARPLHAEGDVARLDAAYDVLLEVRVELQRLTGRRGNVLALQYQDALAAALGDADADALMRRVSAAARAITWTADEAWDRARSWREGPGGSSGRERSLGPGVVLSDGVVHLETAADPAGDAGLALRAAAAAAARGTRIDRASLARLAESAAPPPEPWPDDVRESWIALLGAGRPAVAVIEALDQAGVWERFLPQWPRVRNRPQRNAYHRFTVDRHLIETAVDAAPLTDSVARPDLLLAGALLHDLGKGDPGDHVVAGVELARDAASRMGFDAADTEVLATLVRLHLLLPDTATRRDPSDPATAERVAAEVGSELVLDLLHALCIADSQATGPAAWSPWKAELIAELVARTRQVLTGGPPPVPPVQFPSPEQAALLAAGVVSIDASDDLLTVVAPDRPGLLARVAGTLALHGLDVLSANAVSTGERMALEEFKVGPAGVGSRDVGGEWTQRWPSVLDDLHRAIAGQLAVDARVKERARLYPPQPRVLGGPAPSVVIDNEASRGSTVVEVSAPDSVGLLYRLTRALAELDLDVHTAKVQTLGAQVVDAFYVVDAVGAKIDDPRYLAEIERAVMAVADPGG